MSDMNKPFASEDFAGLAGSLRFDEGNGGPVGLDPERGSTDKREERGE